MNIKLPKNKIDILLYDDIVPIGNKCISRLALNDLNITKCSYPFDYVPTYPKLIWKYIKDPSSFCPRNDTIFNEDGVWFGHFIPANPLELVQQTMLRRFKRLFDLFNSGKKFLLLYTTEADVYNENDSLIRKTINYIHLKELIQHIHMHYPNSNFDVICINTNDERPDEIIANSNIFNYTIYVDDEHISLNNETHNSRTVDPYRRIVTLYLDCIFNGVTENIIHELRKLPIRNITPFEFP